MKGTNDSQSYGLVEATGCTRYRRVHAILAVVLLLWCAIKRNTFTVCNRKKVFAIAYKRVCCIKLLCPRGKVRKIEIKNL